MQVVESDMEGDALKEADESAWALHKKAADSSFEQGQCVII